MMRTPFRINSEARGLDRLTRFSTRGQSTLATSQYAALPGSARIDGIAAFSLVELLVAMMVIILMTGLFTIGFKGTVGANSLTAEGNRISSLVSLARQNAMAKNTLTALVIVTDPQITGSLRAVSIWEVAARTDGTSPEPSDWKQISKWEVLRTGIVIMPPAGTDMNPPTVAANPSFPALTYAGQPVASDGFVCKIFLPSGGLLGAVPGKISLAEGIVPAGTTNPVYTHINTEGLPANRYTITIVAATGHLVVERL